MVEGLCQQILRESDFVRVDVTGRSGGGGNRWGWSVENQCHIFSCAIPIEEMEKTCWKRRRERFRGAMQGRTDNFATGTFTVDAYNR